MKTQNKIAQFSDLYPLIKETIQSGNSFSFLAHGTSMEPLILNAKHTVTLSPISSDLRKNDIVFYRRTDGAFVLHRIVNLEQNGTYTLCGDHQFSFEKGIQKDQIIAKLTKLQNNKKTIALDSFAMKLYCMHLPFRRFLLRIYSTFLKAIQKK